MSLTHRRATARPHSHNPQHRSPLARLCAGLAAGAALLLGSGLAAAQDAAQDMVRRALHVCAACHGADGVSRQAGIPSLAGQQAQYTVAQLKDFRNQTRAETGSKAYMWGVSALLDDATISGLADYYAGLTPPAAAAHGQSAATRRQLQLGKRLFTEGAPSRGIRACAACHGDQAEGAAGFPRLAGQRADYLAAQLRIFSSRLRPHGIVMQAETRAMTPAEMKAVAAYLQTM